MKSNKLAWYWIWKTPALLLPSWPPCLGLPSHKSNPFWLSTLHWKFNHRCCNIWIMNLHSCKELKFKLIPPLLMNQISGEVELFFSRINISFNEESSALIFQGNRHRFEFSGVEFYRWDPWSKFTVFEYVMLLSLGKFFLVCRIQPLLQDVTKSCRVDSQNKTYLFEKIRRE